MYPFTLERPTTLADVKPLGGCGCQTAGRWANPAGLHEDAPGLPAEQVADLRALWQNWPTSSVKAMRCALAP